VPRLVSAPLLAACLGVFALGVGGSVVLASSDVPRGVRVAGTDLGGMSRGEAAAAVRAALGPSTSAPVQLAAAGEPLVLDPAASGLTLDVAAVVDDATSAGPLDRVRALFGADREVAAVTSVDDTRLRAALTSAAQGFDREPREGAVRLRGTTPVAVPPQAGRMLQVDGAVDAVRAAWPTADPIEVPAAQAAVHSSAEQVQAGLAAAREAVGAPVTLRADGASLVVPPVELAKALTFEADANGRIVPDLDAKTLARSVRDRVGALEQAPRDAGFDVSSGKPVVVPGQAGRTVATKDLAAAVLPVLTRDAPRTAELPLRTEQPALTTAEARDLGVKEVVGRFTTEYPCCAPRVTNIHTIADLVDGEVVMPGQTYSLNGDVGARDTARGFVSAPQILDGQFIPAVGGGVSQFATTMYNAAFFAGMQDVEHQPHSYYITRYPEGREATVSTPAPDLKWRNDSPDGVLVTTSYTDTSITVTLWGTERYDEVLSLSSGRSRITDFETEYVSREDCTPAAGNVGFDITITRVMKKDGAEVERDSDTHRYLPEPNFVCTG